MRSSKDFIQPVRNERRPVWQRYLIDSGLAIGGALLLTGLLSIFELYPRIPNISIVYLFIVLGLASLRGRFAAILSSIASFIAFDFFLIPPLHVFTISRAEEWISLLVFLVTAILTSNLSVSLRERARQASRRERETHILYDLVRVTNREDDPQRQFQTLAESIVSAFSSWGVEDCSILFSEEPGKIEIQVSTNPEAKMLPLSSDEQAVIDWVINNRHSMTLHDASPMLATTHRHQRVVIPKSYARNQLQRSLRIIPLKRGDTIIAILRLRVVDTPYLFPAQELLEGERDNLDSATAFFWTFLDQVTILVERIRLQRENLRIEILQRVDRLRVALLSSVSHDLRTPLTAIKASASSLLQEDVQWDKQTSNSFAQTIEREADRLNRLVSNLLDMSRIEEGALKPEKELHSLNGLIYDVTDRLEPLLKEHPLTTHLPSELVFAEIDYMQMDQVLTNLIENAVRYTPSNTPIEISIQPQKDELLLSVADQGPGLPQGEHQRIFDKFYRVLDVRQTHSRPSGSGLGLSVCKGIVEAHGGRIWATRREGGGLIIFITLPLSQAEGSAL